MRRRELTRAVGAVLDHLEEIGLAILLAAAGNPAGPPTAASFSNPDYQNLWSMRLGGATIFELAFVALAAAWLVRSLVARSRTTDFDRPLLVLVLCLVGLGALALAGSIGEIAYFPVDIERVALIAAGYLVVTRCIRDMRALRIFTLVLATVICLQAIYLIYTYGLTGQTEFATILGRTALLITEDGFLLMLPVALAWGALVDGRLTLWGSILAVVGTAAVFVVNLLSLRRGAVLLIGGAVVVRSLGIGARRLLLAAGAILLIAAVGAAFGPGRTILDQARYTVTSSLLSTKDDSSSQRRAELSNFGRNVNGIQWITGRGVGVLWRSEVPAPVDSASFGSKETALNRLGWHVYGLDWAYKFGLLGVGLILATAFLLGRRIFRAYRAADPDARWLIYSLAVCAPPFVLLAFSNPRVALMGGVIVGLLSRCCDLTLAPGSTRARVT